MFIAETLSQHIHRSEVKFLIREKSFRKAFTPKKFVSSQLEMNFYLLFFE